MKGSNTTKNWIKAAGISLLCGLTPGAFGDYQETLAARGADAYTPTSALISIEQEDVKKAFSPEAMQANPALSDQDVMIELQARMRTENHLESAAENLAPADATGNKDRQQTAAASEEKGEKITTELASR